MKRCNGPVQFQISKRVMLSFLEVMDKQPWFSLFFILYLHAGALATQWN